MRKKVNCKVLLVICLSLSMIPISAANEKINTEFVCFGDEELWGILYIPERTPAPAIIISNSMGCNMTWYGRTAEQFCKEGYVVLAFDPRGFGFSGRFFTFENAIEDTLSAVDLLQSREEVIKDKIGIYGESLGSSVALQTATRDPRIKVLVLQGLPIDFRENIYNFIITGCSCLPEMPVKSVIYGFTDIPPSLIQSLLFLPALCCNTPQICLEPKCYLNSFRSGIVCCNNPIIFFNSWGMEISNEPAVSFLSLSKIYKETLRYDVPYYIDEISPRKILLVHGTRDRLTDVNGIINLANGYENVNLALYEGTHGRGVVNAWDSMMKFFNENLMPISLD